jgi:hypothetical protein
MDQARETSVAGPQLASRGHAVKPFLRVRRRWERSSRLQRLLTSNLFLGLILAVIAWPTSTNRLVVTPGLAPAWQAAVVMAAHSHMAFGSRALFTFGPLGFLVSPALFYESYAILAFIFAFAFSTALFSALVWSLRRTIPLPLATGVAYLVGGISLLSSKYFAENITPEDVYALVLIICVSVLSRRKDDRIPWWIWISLGGLFSVFSLVKASLAIGLSAILVITLVCLASDRRRAIGGLALGAVPLFCLGWFGTGNGFQNLIAFARSSVDIINGYGAAMAIETPNRGYPYWLAGFAVLMIAVFAVSHSRLLPRRAQVGIGLVTLATMWFLFKEAFVRHDSHDLVFFVAAPLALAAFSPKWRSPAWPVTGMLGLTLVATTLAGSVPVLITQPVQSARNFGGEARTLLSTARQDKVISESQQLLSSTWRLPKTMLARMQGKTVDVSPWEQTVVWANPGLRYDPLPVLQDYNAYTTSLDKLDASFVRSSAAPQFILRQPLLSIDGRNPAFEPPDAQLAIACRYRQVATYSSWQLLERQANRCGTLRPLRTITTGLGHWVNVPPAPIGDEVLATFQLSNTVWWKLESLLYKPPFLLFAVNDGKETWRFVGGTGPDLHVLHASSNLAYSPDFSPVSAANLEFTMSGGSPSTSGIKIKFYEMPMAAPNGATSRAST